MKTIFFAVGRAVAIGISALGIATAANWSNHKGYWQGTIDRVQTTDFNILSHTLPAKLSYTLIEQDIVELQKTLNSNYGLFGLVVTNCTDAEPSCPDQKIVYQTESQQSWSQRLNVKDLPNYPYDLLQNPPPLNAIGGFENARATTWTPTGLTNSGQIIGRVYYVRGIAPDFWTDYLRWVEGVPTGSLLSDHGAQKYYALTTVLFFFGGLLSWSFIEWLLHSKRLQKRLAQQETERMLKELVTLRQQLRDRLQQVSDLIAERERHAGELSSDRRNKDQRIQELEQAIAQLEKQSVTLDRQNGSASTQLTHSTQLEQNQEALQQEIQQREQAIVGLQSQITAYAQSDSDSTKALEALQYQLTAMTEQQSLDKQMLEQYEQDFAQLRQEIARQAHEKQAKSSLIDLLKHQLRDAQQQTVEAEERRVKLETSVTALNQQQAHDREKLRVLEEKIAAIDQLEEPLTNEFEALVLKHLENRLKNEKGRWRILPNVDVSARGRNRQFVDFLVVGRGCVFVIEAKYYPGTITAEGDAKTTTWYCCSRSNAKPSALTSAGKRNPYEQVNGYCDSTLDKLPAYRTNGKIKVYGIVVFPKDTNVSIISNQIGGYSRVTTLDRLAQMIQDIESAWHDSANAKSNLSPQQIEDVLCGKPVLRKAA